ncbi:MAG: hypothetical protein ACON42_04065 [Flavobacteriaceae bacterium]
MEDKDLFFYSKIILRRVSFSRYLFFKELRKACGQLAPDQSERLERWAYAYYSQKKNSPITTKPVNWE